ncbi:hypothetical protein ACQP1W_01375 [Spirillospora sp. CA-255316]
MTTDQQRPSWAVRLQAERDKRGWGTFETARRLRAATGITRHPTDQVKNLARQITRHESGQIKPRDWASAYARVYGIPERDLFPPSPPLHGAARASTLEQSTTPGQGGDDVKRRQLIQDAGALTAGAVVAPVLATLTEAWQASQPRLPGATVSRAMIDDWAVAYGVHLRRYVMDAPEVVLAGLTRDWAEMAPHLATRQPEDVGRDLAHAAAKLAYLIAGTAVQLHDARLASRWWLTARDLADRSGDALLSAYTRAWEVTNRVAEPRENLAELLTLARGACRRAGERPSATLMYATTVEAEVLAFMGDHSAAVGSMRRAEEVFERLPSGEPHREELLRFDQSCVYSLAGHRHAADEAQQAALRFYRPDTHLYSAVQLKLYRAAMHARTDPGEAGREAMSVINSVPVERRIKRVTLTARHVLDAMPQRARVLPAARELQALAAGA